MPVQVSLRNPSTGRFVSADDAFGVGATKIERDSEAGTVTVTPYEDWARESEQEGPSFVWDYQETDRGAIATPTFQFDEWDESFDVPFRDDVDAFRVIFTVESDARYQRGHASSDWVKIADWPPKMNMVEEANPNGVESIRFRRS